MVQLYRLPFLGAIGRRDKIKDRAALDGIGGIPAGAYGDGALARAIDILGGDADVVFLGKVFGDDVLLPVRVMIPLYRMLVGENDVRLAVAIDVGNRQPVTDADFIDLLRFKFRLRWRGERRGGEK